MFARVTVSPEHTLRFAEEVGKRLEKGTVILYEGGLGAGKTTFTKGLAKGLGITETVTSPTFALVNEYYGRLPLFHFDLYRINSVDELYSIGFFDYLDKDGVIAAEWSENIPELEKELKNVVKVRIDKLSDTERRILLLWS